MKDTRHEMFTKLSEVYESFRREYFRADMTYLLAKDGKVFGDFFERSDTIRLLREHPGVELLTYFDTQSSSMDMNNPAHKGPFLFRCKRFAQGGMEYFSVLHGEDRDQMFFNPYVIFARKERTKKDELIQYEALCGVGYGNTFEEASEQARNSIKTWNEEEKDTWNEELSKKK